MTTITIDPVTRIEGHLKIELTVDFDGSIDRITDAKSSGTMFRGFEKILQGRDPLDAPHLTQRICGVCPISHGMAASLNLESAFDMTPPDNGRILRNLVLGANYLQSHILHFYHLAALDYINTESHPATQKGPWIPRYVTPDMVSGGTANTLVDHYVAALAIRRKCHQMGAIFGGKQPCSPTMTPGGCTEVATTEAIAAFSALLTEITAFIDNTMLPDVLDVAALFPEYYQIGHGCGNLLSYGVFDTDNDGGKMFQPGLITDGVEDPNNMDAGLITEYVGNSYFTSASGNLNPAEGVTEPDPFKSNAYSWLKSPRYQDKVYEVGPLARMLVSKRYSGGISVIDRIAARAYEAQAVAYAMADWLSEDLVAGEVSYTKTSTPTSGSGMGLTEAPRGALGHWIDIEDKVISRYQVVTPTNWNASPMDDAGEKGPIEQALIGTPIADISQPIEALRVVHSFDPCLACSVHMLRPGKKAPEAVVETSIGF